MTDVSDHRTMLGYAISRLEECQQKIESVQVHGTYTSADFLDIPESALLNRPLTGSIVDDDGIWNDFCGLATYPDADIKLSSEPSFGTTIDIDSLPVNRKLDLNVSKIDGNIENAIDLEIPVRKRNILSSQDARGIFMYLLAGIDDRPGASVFVSEHYGVSPKTVRDIWNRFVHNIA